MQPASLPLQALKAVFFDMDGVIIDSMPFHAQAWKKTFASIGLAITPEEVYAREGETGSAAVKYFLRQREIHPSDDQIKKLLERKEQYFAQLVRYRFFNGIQNLILRLLKLKKRLALVTGTSRQELGHILPPEWLGKFEVVISGSEVLRGKPDPEPYQKALKAMNLLPAEALVIENAPFGIQSARAAGIRCLAVATSLTCTHLEGAEYCFKNIKELSRFLLKGTEL